MTPIPQAAAAGSWSWTCTALAAGTPVPDIWAQARAQDPSIVPLADNFITSLALGRGGVVLAITAGGRLLTTASSPILGSGVTTPSLISNDTLELMTDVVQGSCRRSSLAFLGAPDRECVTYCVALKSDGSAWPFGSNARFTGSPPQDPNGELGIVPSGLDIPQPLIAAPAAEPLTHVAAGTGYQCVVGESGCMRCFYTSERAKLTLHFFSGAARLSTSWATAQCANETADGSKVLAGIPIAELITGPTFVYARLANGSVKGWGYPLFGELSSTQDVPLWSSGSPFLDFNTSDDKVSRVTVSSTEVVPTGSYGGVLYAAVFGSGRVATWGRMSAVGLQPCGASDPCKANQAPFLDLGVNTTANPAVDVALGDGWGMVLFANGSVKGFGAVGPWFAVPAPLFPTSYDPATSPFIDTGVAAGDKVVGIYATGGNACWRTARGAARCVGVDVGDLWLGSAAWRDTPLESPAARGPSIAAAVRNANGSLELAFACGAAVALDRSQANWPAASTPQQLVVDGCATGASVALPSGAAIGLRNITLGAAATACLFGNASNIQLVCRDCGMAAVPQLAAITTIDVLGRLDPACASIDSATALLAHMPALANFTWQPATWNPPLDCLTLSPAAVANASLASFSWREPSVCGRRAYVVPLRVPLAGGGTVVTTACDHCPPGAYCFAGDVAVDCPAGTYRAAADGGSVADCTSCPSGMYAPSPGATACSACPPGTYAQAAIGARACAACPPGTYSASEGGANGTVCHPCEKGSAASSSGSTACSTCPAGSYANVTGQAACTLCRKGFFSVEEGATNATACSPCAPGSYASTLGATACTLCPATTYQPTWAVTSVSSCVSCPPGTASALAGSAACGGCEPGYYAPGGTSACRACSRGTYAASANATECEPCPVGSYSTAAAASCSVCPPGTYADAAGSGSCTACPPGTASAAYNATRNTTCEPCGSGSYAPAGGSASCSLCPPGTRGNGTGAVSLSECVSCPPGTASSVTGATLCATCAPGYYSASAGATACTACDVGTYLDTIGATSAAACQPCGAGTYGAAAGQTSAGCLACPSGTSSSVTGATSSEGCRACPPGTASSVAGAGTCHGCEPGYYAPGGTTACAACPRGTYAASANATECEPCPSGSYSAAAAATCAVCPPGTYAGMVGSGSCTACPPGTASSAYNASSNTTCEPCSSGSYAPMSGSITCSLCPPGTRGNGHGAVLLAECLPCLPGSASSVPGGTLCSPCEPGYYAIGGTTACVACPRGTYALSANATECQPCPPGSFAGPGASTCSTCPPGTYAEAAGSGSCTACPPGTVSAAYNATSDATCEPCSSGSYAPASGSASCNLCPPGTKGNGTGAVAQAQCVPCPPGTSSSVAGGNFCAACAPGYFNALPGATACSACSAGTFLDAVGATSDGACQPCGAGTYGAAPGQTSAGCLACPPGTASATFGAASPATCTPCAPGYFASSSGTATCGPCPPGSYGGGGASCSLCPKGSWSASRNASSTATCQACPSGSTTVVEGAKAVADCLVQSFTCPFGWQPLSIATPPQSLTDCALLRCEGGLVLSPDGSTCIGCANGTHGKPPECSRCPPKSFCPGGMSVALALPSALVDVRGNAPAPDSPSAPAPEAPPVTAAAAAPSALSALQTTSVAVIATLLVVVVLATAAWGHVGHGRAATLLRAVDRFALSHEVEEGSPLLKRSTPLGGGCTLLSFVTLAAVWAVVIMQRNNDNVLVQASVVGLSTDALLEAARVPPSLPKGGGGGAPLVLIIAAEGEPGACDSLTWSSDGMSSSFGWELESTSPSPQRAVHKLSCADCLLHPSARLAARLHWSCQSVYLRLEAADVDGAVHTLEATSASPNATAATLVARLMWTHALMLQVKTDTVNGVQGRGYVPLPPAATWEWTDSTPSSGLLPLTAAVALDIPMPPPSTYTRVEVSEKVPLAQLASMLAGWAGILGVFGVAFAAAERGLRYRAERSAAVPLQLRKPCGKPEARAVETTNVWAEHNRQGQRSEVRALVVPPGSTVEVVAATVNPMQSARASRIASQLQASGAPPGDGAPTVGRAAFEPVATGAVAGTRANGSAAVDGR